jgi:hypothetical protein
MTMETNETSSEHPVELPASGEEKTRKSWHGCLIAVLVIMALFFLGLMLLPPLGQPSEHSCAVNCFGNLMQDWSILRWGLSDDNGDEAWTPPPDWTLVDLIHEYESRKYDYPPVFRGCVHIRPQTWIEEIRDSRETERQHYLVFPVPASVVFDDSLQPSVPILMCPPGAHREFGTNVLYSNGDVKTLTLEEAEKLVAEQSPVPLEIVFETGLAGPDKKDDRK